MHYLRCISAFVNLMKHAVVNASVIKYMTILVFGNLIIVSYIGNSFLRFLPIFGYLKMYLHNHFKQLTLGVLSDPFVVITPISTLAQRGRTYQKHLRIKQICLQIINIRKKYLNQNVTELLLILNCNSSSKT